MRYIFGLLTFVIASTSFGQNFAKTAPIPVATGYGYYHPQIEITNDGFPAVIWTDFNANNIYFSKHNGTDFDTPVTLNPPNLDVQSYNWSGPDISIDGDNVYVVFRSLGYETGHVYMVKSTNNGTTWSDTIRVDDLPTGFGQYPDIVALNDTVWVTMMDHDNGGANPEYVVTRSTDGGTTWEPAVAAGSLWAGEACDCCQPEIVANDNYVIVFFRNNLSNIRDIKAVVSFDRGATFTGQFSVDDHMWSIAGCPSIGPDARMMTADKVLCVYRTYVSNTAKIFINEYDVNNDVSVDLIEVSADASTGPLINYPQMDYRNGDLGVVWEGSGNSIDVFFNASTTGASGLDPANAINITDASVSQNKPDIIIDANGKFHIVYADSDGQDIKYVQVTNSGAGLEEMDVFHTSVYPAPATEVVTFKFDNPEQQKFTFELYALNGTRLQQITASGSQYVLNRGDLAAGTYLYKIQLEDAISEGKVVFK
ncbi:MAG: exo-alpha-sialidase [Crocinitomicaceae bacterium]|nr:exo-alpha-sialidase [Crocinitomicaceae bacterium]